MRARFFTTLPTGQPGAKGLRRKLAIRAAIQGVLVLLCVLTVGTIPGSPVRPVVLERLAPPLPEGRDRDAAIDVYVREAGGGPPLGGAHVQIIRVVEGRAFLAGAGWTDGQGAVVVGNLPRGEVWLLADAPKHARASSQLVLTSERRRVDIELGPEHDIDVLVSDDRGAPLEGAEVEVAGADPLPVGARADASGRAAVARLSEPPWIVTVRAPGFETVTRRGVAPPGPERVTLRKLGALVVTVVDQAGATVASAEVQVGGAALYPPRSATTSPEGFVRIGELSAGVYALRAVHGERVTATELAVPLDRGEEKSLTLRLVQGRIISVRVMDGDSEDAEPIAGARLALAEGGLSPFPLEASTDREGRARLGPIAPGAASLSARAEGFVQVSRWIEDGISDVRIALARAGAVTGRVLDARGFPVDGASIEIVGTDPFGEPIDDDPRRARFREAHFAAVLSGPRALVPSGELGVVPGPVPPIPRGSGEPGVDQAGALAAPTGGPEEEPWVTRADGTFRASPATPGRVRVLVRHPQYVEALSDVVSLAPAGEAHVDVVMRQGGALEGRVLDGGGRPIAAHVTIAAVRGSLERSVVTSSDGSFAFASLPEEVTLTAGREDDPQTSTRLTVSIPEGGQRSVTITLPDARAPLEARVLDERGFPVDAVQLSAVSLDPSAPLRETVFTDPHGEARLPSARGLPLRVEVRAPGHAAKVVTVEPSAATLEVALGVAHGATGEVRSERGRDPIEGAELVLYADDGTHRTRSDVAGAFAFADIPAGGARLRVRATGYASLERDIVVEDTGRPTDLGRLELAQEGIVTGTVVNERGDGVPGARVAKDRVPTFLAVGATPQGIAVADAQGRFRLTELAEGTLALEAYAADLGRARIEGVRVSAGRTTDGIKIVLHGSGGGGAEPAAAGGVAITLGETGGDPREVVIVSVAEGSEAERAGLAPGDTLLEVDRAAVHTMGEARARLSGPLADDVVVAVRRAGKTETLRVPREPVRR